jgi:hypothetical protein
MRYWRTTEHFPLSFACKARELPTRFALLVRGAHDPRLTAYHLAKSGPAVLADSVFAPMPSLSADLAQPRGSLPLYTDWPSEATSALSRGTRHLMLRFPDLLAWLVPNQTRHAAQDS